MPNWLASYLKSGSTWLRVLLTKYLSDEAETAQTNELPGRKNASARHLITSNFNFEASDITKDELEFYYPRLFGLYASRLYESRSF